MSVKIYRTDNPVLFNYSINNELIELEAYEGSTLFLSALNAFILHNNRDKTKWIFNREVSATNVATFYLGRDGLNYKLPQPTALFERIEGALNPMTLLPSITYVSLSLESEVGMLDSEVFVRTANFNYESMATWKAREIYTGSAANATAITGLKETVTGFTLNLSKLNLVLTLSGDPLPTENPISVAIQMNLIRVHFYSRPDRIVTLGDDGTLEI